MRIILIAGARPNFMKIAPLAHAFLGAGVEPVIVHTGQHYDAKMSHAFFDELDIPEPNVNLEVGSGSHVHQIAEVMKRLEPILAEDRLDAVVVVGDVNSTAAATIAAVKYDVPVAHVEAGLRSHDRTMPEEINRILTDSISRWLFTSERSAEANLRAEGVAAERIHFVGNVMIDTLLKHRERASRLCAHRQFGLEPSGYALLTLHRPSNVDSAERFESILRAIHVISARLPVLFVVHPRTRQRYDQFEFAGREDLNGFVPAEPLGYHAMVGLMDSARLVLTDSGGIQEETTALGVPCLTLRENTERPITIDEGTNRLVGWRTDDVLNAFNELPSPEHFQPTRPENWDGRAAERIVHILQQELS